MCPEFLLVSVEQRVSPWAFIYFFMGNFSRRRFEIREYLGSLPKSNDTFDISNSSVNL